MKELFRYAAHRYLLRKAQTRRAAYASHAGFYAVTSAVPLLMIFLLFAARAFPERLSLLLSALRETLPPVLSAYLPEDLLLSALSGNASVLPLSVLTMLWSSSKGVRALAEGLRAVYGETKKSDLILRNLSAFALTAGFLTGVLLILSLPVLWEGVARLFLTQTARRERSFLALPAFCPLLFLLFAGAYRLCAPEKASFCGQLPGAALAAIGWTSYTALLFLYPGLFGERFFLSVYGSLGALLLWMFWSRRCTALLLFGAEVNVFWRECREKALFSRFSGGKRK